MAEEDAADRAAQEIRALCRKLDPRNTSHKDRIRRLNKFRNFVTGVRFFGCLVLLLVGLLFVGWLKYGNIV